MDKGLWITLFMTLGLGFIGFMAVLTMGFVKNQSLDRGEMRRAITAFFVVLFGLLVVASFFPTKLTLPPQIQGLFAGTVTTIIGFYFGSRGAVSPGAPISPTTATPPTSGPSGTATDPTTSAPPTGGPSGTATGPTTSAPPTGGPSGGA